LKSFIHHPAKEHLSMADKIPSVPTALLDLDTLTERPFVLIDQVKYELRTPEELSVLEHRRLGKIGARLDVIEQLEDASEEDEQEYDQLLKTLTGRVLLAPDEVKARLKTAQCVAVAVAFTRLRLTTSPSPVGAKMGTRIMKAPHRRTARRATTGAS
jgi:hypothetical protein